MTDDEKGARARLGEWCAAEQCRTWTASLDAKGSTTTVRLYTDALYFPMGFGRKQTTDGSGPTLAAAIIAALEVANG